MRSIRVFIACADERLRLALIILLDHDPGLLLVGISDRLTGLLVQLAGSEPDVLLLDWDIPLDSMKALLADLHTLKHQPKTIILSTRPRDKEQLLAAGAYHFISKNAPPDDLLPVLNDIRLSQPAA
jgi:DNA-binding NarL/FixJ family response regulator